MAEYNRLVGEWLANGRRLPAVTYLTVNELVPPYIRHFEQYYVKGGEMTNQVYLGRDVALTFRFVGPRSAPSAASQGGSPTPRRPMDSRGRELGQPRRARLRLP